MWIFLPEAPSGLVAPNPGASGAPQFPIWVSQCPAADPGAGNRRNNRLFPLGGSSVHACLPVSPRPAPERHCSPTPGPSPPFFLRLHHVLQEEVLPGKGRHRGYQRKPSGPSLKAGLWSGPELSQAPLSGWVPPQAIAFSLPSLRFSLICHFPTATFTPAAPFSFRVSSSLIGR